MKIIYKIQKTTEKSTKKRLEFIETYPNSFKQNIGIFYLIMK